MREKVGQEGAKRPVLRADNNDQSQVITVNRKNVREGHSYIE